MSDRLWTLFVRSWREVGRENHARWVDSPERIGGIVAKHPLPWIIDRDWTYEVIASDGACVAKKMTYESAAAFIATATALSKLAGEGK